MRFAFFLLTFSVSSPLTLASPNDPKPLDGILIDAVETYKDPRHHEIGFAVALYPFNSFTTGFGLGAHYLHHFNKTWGWEVLNASYVYSVDKSISSQLADRFGVNPEAIERLSYVISTNTIYTFIYGKAVLFEDFIRTYRSSLVLGAGLVSTNQKSNVAGNVGYRLNAFASDTFAWNLEVRDAITFSGGIENNVSFSLGTSLSF